MPAVPLQSLWSVTAPAGPVCGRLEEALHAQVAVIGAGYTGLSAALHLAERGREVVVLEAADIGARASGTNGGQVIPGVKHDPDTLERIFGHDAGSRLVATAAAGPDLVFELIGQHGIECDAVRTGWIQPAESDEALAELAARVEQWRRRGAAVELLSREAMRRLTGSQHYRGGLLDRRGGTLQPLSYVRGLAAAALRVGARIFTESPALELTRSAHGWSIETPRGIPAALRPQILPEGQAASDTRRLLRYFRVDGSGRLVLGSRGTFAQAPGVRSVQRHYRAVHEIYPQLAGLPFEYHWGGLVAMTPDHLPHLHELAPGLLAGLGYNGRGVAMATMMGRLLARLALGVPAAELGFPVTAMRPVPLHALSGIAVRAAIQYLRLADALERARRVHERRGPG